MMHKAFDEFSLFWLTVKQQRVNWNARLVYILSCGVQTDIEMYWA